MIINLMGQKWRVRYSARNPLLFDSNGQMLAGRLDTDSNTIWINSKLNGEQRASTLFHEILHWVSYSIGRNMSEKDIMSFESHLWSIFDIRLKRCNVLKE